MLPVCLGGSAGLLFDLATLANVSVHAVCLRLADGICILFRAGGQANAMMTKTMHNMAHANLMLLYALCNHAIQCT